MVRPKILIVENAVDITGGLTSALRTSQALRDQFDFAFVLPKKSRVRKIVEESGFDVYEMPFAEIRKQPGALLWYFPALFLNVLRFRALVRRVRPNLIVANDFYNLVPAAYRALGGKIPYVCFIRFVPSRFPGILVRRWMSVNLNYASKIIAVSDTVLQDCAASAKVIRIYDPLPAANPAYEPLPEATTILCLANYIRGKGQHAVLESFSRISSNFPKWKIRFVGSEMGLQKNVEYKNELLLQAKNLGLEHQTEWHPATPLPEHEYRSCAFSVNFSESESFSLTCLESLYAGRTVIATRSGGPAEIIDDGVTGLLVPVGDIEAMGLAFQKLMSDAVGREAMSRKAYTVVREKFNASRTTDLLSAVYLTLTQSH